jgi:molybdopterin-biosynthesis enzyme MoeA-like protein
VAVASILCQLNLDYQTIAAALLHDVIEDTPTAKAEIQAKFGAEAYPHRVLMAEFPQGSRIIPNPYNRVAAFAIRDHHFFPGFPQMAWPMLDWVLATKYRRCARRPAERDRRLWRGREPAPAGHGRQRRAFRS